MTIKEILDRLQEVKKTGDGWLALCPAHKDKQASLSVGYRDERILLHCHAGCEIEDIVTAMGLKLSDLFNKESVCCAYPPVQAVQVSKLEQHIENKEVLEIKPGHPPKSHCVQVSRLQCTLSDYSKIKNLPECFLRSLGVTERKYKRQTKLVIPYYSENGELVCERYRKRMAGDQKFAWEKGAHPCLYGLWRSKSYSKDFVVLIEGESDSQTLWLNEVPALGLPGASMWKEERDAPHLEKFEIIYVVIEPDQGGEGVLRWIGRSKIKQKVKLITTTPVIMVYIG